MSHGRFDNALATPVITRGSSIVRTIEALEPGQGWRINLGQKQIIADSNSPGGIKIGTAGNAVFTSYVRLTPGNNCYAVQLTASQPGYYMILDSDEDSVSEQINGVDATFSGSIPGGVSVLAVPFIAANTPVTHYTQHMKRPWVCYSTAQHGNTSGILYVTELLARGITVD